MIRLIHSVCSVASTTLNDWEHKTNFIGTGKKKFRYQVSSMFFDGTIKHKYFNDRNRAISFLNCIPFEGKKAFK